MDFWVELQEQEDEVKEQYASHESLPFSMFLDCYPIAPKPPLPLCPLRGAFGRRNLPQ